MSLTWRRWNVCGTMSLWLAAVLVMPAAAQQNAENSPPAANQNAGQAAEPAPLDLTVPEGSPDELLQFIERVRSATPVAKTGQEQRREAHARGRAIVTAADRILGSQQATPEQAEAAITTKLGTLDFLVQLGDPTALGELRQFADQVKAQAQANLAELGQYYAFVARLYAVRPDSRADLPQLLDSAKDFVGGGPLNLQRVRVALVTAQTLEQQEDYDLALEAYRDFGQQFQQHGDPSLARFARLMEHRATQLEWIGKPFELAGTTLDGAQIAPADYEGKVLLVVFWATWCGPCRADLPQIRHLHDTYQPDGLEIIGVSLDPAQSADEVKAFVAAQKISWPILLESEPAQSGWRHPLAQRYGVSAIPAAMLVDRDGTIVGFPPSGEQREQQIRKLLGLGAAIPAPKPETSPEPPSDPPPPPSPQPPQP